MVRDGVVGPVTVTEWERVSATGVRYEIAPAVEFAARGRRYRASVTKVPINRDLPIRLAGRLVLSFLDENGEPRMWGTDRLVPARMVLDPTIIDDLPAYARPFVGPICRLAALGHAWSSGHDEPLARMLPAGTYAVAINGDGDTVYAVPFGVFEQSVALAVARRAMAVLRDRVGSEAASLDAIIPRACGAPGHNAVVHAQICSAVAILDGIGRDLTTAIAGLTPSMEVA